jgi:hypothetical protein
MAFVCPNCLTPQALNIDKSITLPPESRSDDILLQTVRCSQCGFRGAAVYEESRRGGMDSESWDHRGYHLSESDLKWLSALINRCPAKKNKKCLCQAHEELGQKNEYGRWIRPESFAWEESFPMRLR